MCVSRLSEPRYSAISWAYLQLVKCLFTTTYIALTLLKQIDYKNSCFFSNSKKKYITYKAKDILPTFVS